MREKMLDVTIQGLTPDMKCNGEFDPVEIREMTLSRALDIIRNMPNLPTDQKANRDYCPPQIVFDKRLAVSHIERGKYSVFPRDRFYTLEEVETIVIAHYNLHSK